MSNDFFCDALVSGSGLEELLGEPQSSAKGVVRQFLVGLEPHLPFRPMGLIAILLPRGPAVASSWGWR